MRRILLALAVMWPVASDAADIPQSSTRDNRIQYVNYHASDVVVIHSTVGYISRIVFEKGETIQDGGVGAGFTAGWNLNHKGNILYVSPQSIRQGDDHPPQQPYPAEWNTNIVVATNKRLYDFEVRLLPANYKGREHNVFYRIEFRYPTEEAAKQQAAMERAEAKEAKKARGLPQPRSWDYRASPGKNSTSIMPDMAYDDGRFTYLRFSNNREIPAVYILGADGSENKVNMHMHPEEPDVMVIHRVSERMVLRLGRSVVSIHNRGFDYTGVAPVDGTTVRGLKRITRGE